MKLLPLTITLFSFFLCLMNCHASFGTQLPLTSLAKPSLIPQARSDVPDTDKEVAHCIFQVFVCWTENSMRTHMASIFLCMCTQCLAQGPASLFSEWPYSKYLDFVDHTVFVTTTQVCHSAKENM